MLSSVLSSGGRGTIRRDGWGRRAAEPWWRALSTRWAYRRGGVGDGEALAVRPVRRRRGVGSIEAGCVHHAGCVHRGRGAGAGAEVARRAWVSANGSDPRVVRQSGCGGQTRLLITSLPSVWLAWRASGVGRRREWGRAWRDRVAAEDSWVGTGGGVRDLDVSGDAHARGGAVGGEDDVLVEVDLGEVGQHAVVALARVRVEGR